MSDNSFEQLVHEVSSEIAEDLYDAVDVGALTLVATWPEIIERVRSYRHTLEHTVAAATRSWDDDSKTLGEIAKLASLALDGAPIPEPCDHLDAIIAAKVVQEPDRP